MFDHVAEKINFLKQGCQGKYLCCHDFVFFRLRIKEPGRSSFSQVPFSILHLTRFVLTILGNWIRRKRKKLKPRDKYWNHLALSYWHYNYWLWQRNKTSFSQFVHKLLTTGSGKRQITRKTNSAASRMMRLKHFVIYHRNNLCLVQMVLMSIVHTICRVGR